MKTTLSLLAAACLLAACSTPKPILEQANHTVGLIGELSVALRDFDRVQTLVLESRLRSVAEQERDLMFVEGQSRMEDAARLANGDTVPANLLARINGVANEIREADRRNRDRSAELDAEFAKLLKPIVSSGAKLDVAQQSVAAFSRELPASTRLAEFRTFARKVKQDVDANRNKLEQSEAAVASGKE